MLGIKHIKFDASTYVLHYKNGRVVKEGKGLSFYFNSRSSSIVAVPMGTDDVPFIFNQTTADSQNVTVQGQLTYKVEAPKQLGEMLDFSVDANGKYIKNDKEKLHQRLVNESQTASASFMQSLSVKDAVRSAKQVEQEIARGLKDSPAIAMLGITPLTVNILAIKPEPNTAKALEAHTREALLKEADSAIYERRNFAVEQERRIKESELSTEIAIEEKKKQISQKQMEAQVEKAQNDRKLREMKIDADNAVATKEMEAAAIREKNDRALREMRMAANIELEEQRRQLVATKVENEKAEAEAQAYAQDLMLTPYKEMDWRRIMALTGKGLDAKTHIAMAFNDLAQNAQRIGNLNISPDLLQNLITEQQQR